MSAVASLDAEAAALPHTHVCGEAALALPPNGSVPPDPVVLALVVQALLHGTKLSQGRVRDLLGISRWTVRRAGRREVAAHAAVFAELARSAIVATADRGSTADERAGAVTWLEKGAKSTGTAVVPVEPTKVTAGTNGSGRNRGSKKAPPKRHIARASAPAAAMLDPAPGKALQQLQHIRRRSLVVATILASRQTDLDAAVLDLVRDITASADALEPVLAQIGMTAE